MTLSDFEKARRQQEREAEKAKRALAARQREHERLRTQRDTEAKKKEVESANEKLAGRIDDLQGLLVHGIDALGGLSLARLRRTSSIRPLVLGHLERPRTAPSWEDFAPPPPGFWRSSLAQSSVARDLEAARFAFEQAQAEFATREAAREEAVNQKRARYARAAAAEKADVDRHNAALDDLARRVRARRKGSVETNLLSVLGLVPLPEGFPRELQVAFDPKTEQVVMEFELPKPDCVPSVKEFRYLVGPKRVSETARPAT